MIAQSAAVMAVCSWIAVPASVPFTLQMLGVFLSVGLLGVRNGTISVILYLLLGAAGLPVFSGFSGGIGHMLGPTGGYIIGFLFSALVMWLIECLFGRGMVTFVLSMVAGLLVCYAFGTAWFIIVYTKSNGNIGVMTALAWCVLPYLIPDALKIALAADLTRRIRPLMNNIGN